MEMVMLGVSDVNVKNSINGQLPKSHQYTDPVVCKNCLLSDPKQYTPTCNQCFQLLMDPSTSISQIFAVLRQWNPQTQKRVDIYVQEILNRGAHINDKDGLTDMTLLQYACRSGAEGMFEEENCCNVIKLLVKKNADLFLRCRWTDMAAIHYAVFFDVVSGLQLLLQESKCLDIDSPCSSFDNGGPLHIAALNISINSARLLIEFGANLKMKNNNGQIPFDCVPDIDTLENEDLKSNAKDILQLLEVLEEPNINNNSNDTNLATVSAKVTLQSLNLKIGDKVLVGGVKTGTLKYCGKTEFAQGIWAGIELDENVGKNDGSIGGISYFHCSKEHGIFAPISKITKFDENRINNYNSDSNFIRKSHTALQNNKLDVSHVTAKIDTGLSKRTNSPPENCLEIGDKVIVAGKKLGTLRFSGLTDFATGWWYGIELDQEQGRNNGSINGKVYFNCKKNYGVFAPSTKVKRCDLLVKNETLEIISNLKSNNSSSHSLNSQSKSPSRLKLSLNEPELRLQIGTNVLCNNELATVKFIGTVDFEDGPWIGVEMRKPIGKNDGSVLGKRYFTTKQDHGLLVRPSKVTVRGINATNLPPFNN